MKNDILRNIGIVGIVLGGGISVVAYSKYDKGMGQYNLALDRLDFDTMYAWSDNLNNAKIALVIGIVILIVSAICLVAYYMSSHNSTDGKIDKDIQRTNGSATERMKDLKQMYEEGLITENEYLAKKENILDEM